MNRSGALSVAYSVCYPYRVGKIWGGRWTPQPVLRGSNTFFSPTPPILHLHLSEVSQPFQAGVIRSGALSTAYSVRHPHRVGEIWGGRWTPQPVLRGSNNFFSPTPPSLHLHLSEVCQPFQAGVNRSGALSVAYSVCHPYRVSEIWGGRWTPQPVLRLSLIRI